MKHTFRHFISQALTLNCPGWHYRDQSSSKSLSSQFTIVGKSKNLLSYLSMSETKERLDFQVYMSLRKKQRKGLYPRMSRKLVMEIEIKEGLKRRKWKERESHTFCYLVCVHVWNTNFQYVIAFNTPNLRVEKEFYSYL